MEPDVTRRIYRILSLVGIVLFLFGLGITPVWLGMGWFGGRNLGRTEFPLGDPVDVAVDSHGRLYVADGFYMRVQRYSPDGVFDLGWQIPGVIGLRMTPADEVEVATRSASTVETFSAEGDLLRTTRVDNIWSYLPERKTPGPYIARRGLLPRIVSRETNRPLIVTRVPRRMLAAPFPAFAYCIAGIGLLAAGQWLQRRRPLQ